MKNGTSAVPTAQASQSAFAPFASALARIDVATWAALIAIVLGWFLLETLRVEWGPIDRRVPFYDLAVVVSSPMTLFTGTEGHRGLGTVLFVTLCCISLLMPLLPYVWRNRFAWLASAAPLALMLVAAFLLYTRTSDSLPPPDSGLADTIAHDVRHLANHILHHARESVARKVTFAAGGYFAVLGSLYLGARGVRGFRTFSNQPE
jgi:hypothetical protein